MDNLWVVGLFVECKECRERWFLKGVYDSEKKAIAACTLDNYFIIPMELNALGADEIEKAKGYYPRRETKEEAAKRLSI